MTEPLSAVPGPFAGSVQVVALGIVFEPQSVTAPVSVLLPLELPAGLSPKFVVVAVTQPLQSAELSGLKQLLAESTWM